MCDLLVIDYHFFVAYLYGQISFGFSFCLIDLFWKSLINSESLDCENAWVGKVVEWHLQVLCEECFHRKPERYVKAKLGILGSAATVSDVSVNYGDHFVQHGVWQSENSCHKPDGSKNDAETEVAPQEATGLWCHWAPAWSVDCSMWTTDGDVPMNGNHTHGQCGHVYTTHL